MTSKHTSEPWVQENQLLYRTNDPGHYQFYARASGCEAPATYLNNLEAEIARLRDQMRRLVEALESTGDCEEEGRWCITHGQNECGITALLAELEEEKE